jgi:hypothetical protein
VAEHLESRTALSLVERPVDHTFSAGRDVASNRGTADGSSAGGVPPAPGGQRPAVDEQETRRKNHASCSRVVMSDHA